MFEHCKSSSRVISGLKFCNVRYFYESSQCIHNFAEANISSPLLRTHYVCFLNSIIALGTKTCLHYLTSSAETLLGLNMASRHKLLRVHWIFRSYYFKNDFIFFLLHEDNIVFITSPIYACLYLHANYPSVWCYGFDMNVVLILGTENVYRNSRNPHLTVERNTSK